MMPPKFFLHVMWLLSGSDWSRVNLTCWRYDGFSCYLREFQKVTLHEGIISQPHCSLLLLLKWEV